MTHSLPTFAAQVKDILLHHNTSAGREKVAGLLREALADRRFVESLFDQDSPERKVVYQDPQLGFCILAHRYRDAKTSPPHDHGPSWAIYGQADGETTMSDWEPTGVPAAGKPTPVKKVREYTLVPGAVRVYNEGDVHSPSRAGPTRLIRIEGINMEGVARGRYEAAHPGGT
jgi:predicted metal-dependent enzyme (double-stranded beta helix superfamily)